MKNNSKIFIFIIAIVLLLIGSSVVTYFSERVPSNDISVTGNTAGNLNNGGLFAENNGKIYFANAYDNGCMYSMNADETELQKITTSQVASINTGGDFLYYYMNSSGGGTGLGYVVKTFGVYRSKTDGSATKCLDRNAAVTMQLVGDYIYYQRYNNQDFTKFYKIKTDKTDNVQVSDEIINPAACDNGLPESLPHTS